MDAFFRGKGSDANVSDVEGKPLRWKCAGADDTQQCFARKSKLPDGNGTLHCACKLCRHNGCCAIEVSVCPLDQIGANPQRKDARGQHHYQESEQAVAQWKLQLAQWATVQSGPLDHREWQVKPAFTRHRRSRFVRITDLISEVDCIVG